MSLSPGHSREEVRAAAPQGLSQTIQRDSSTTFMRVFLHSVPQFPICKDKDVALEEGTCLPHCD